jgi:hypothetical protein
MALDPVPWFIGGAAEHSAEAARNIAWNATQGRTGVSTPASLKVSATPTPGGSVRIAAGGAAVESTYAGASQQSYTIRNDAMITVPVPANTGSTTVTRIVGIEVRDPQYKGNAPSNPADGPYVFASASLPAFSSGDRHPYIPLATIRIPPGTSVITDAMITDTRELMNPRRSEIVHARPRVNGEDGRQAELRARLPSGEYFPGGGGFANEVTVRVPEWATRMTIDARWMGVRYTAGKNVYGQLWVEYGTEYKGKDGWPGNQQWEYATQKFQFDSAGSRANTYRTDWSLMDTMYVPAKLRGEDVTFVFKAGLHANSDTGVMVDALGGLGMRLTFAEQAIDYDTL